MAFMSLSFRQSHCHDLLMAKAKSFSVFERGRIVELHKQGRVQRTITAEVGRSKTFLIFTFLKRSWEFQRSWQKRQVVYWKKISETWSKRATLFSWKKSFIRWALWTAALFCRKTQSLPHRRGPSRGMPAATYSHSQPPFDARAQPEAPLSHWRKKHPRSWSVPHRNISSGISLTCQ